MNWCDVIKFKVENGFEYRCSFLNDNFVFLNCFYEYEIIIVTTMRVLKLLVTMKLRTMRVTAVLLMTCTTT